MPLLQQGGRTIVYRRETLDILSDILEDQLSLNHIQTEQQKIVNRVI